ncbi:MAG: HD-GYP domain-containing protein [Treponema sp.]|nr:HD-GYP domain-containing protein [Treponema sp.]
MGLELTGALLLFMDRFAYIYRGNLSNLGFWMVRISNFSVFLFSLTIVHLFTIYLCDLYKNEGHMVRIPVRLYVCEIIFLFAVLMLLISQLNGFYYYFDENNLYHRSSPGYLLSYLFPFTILLLQFTVIIQYKNKIPKGIRIPLLLFFILPALATIMQFFFYGLSLQNIAMVGEVVILHISSLIDINRTVENANNMKLNFLKEEQKNMRIMFDQTATALANAIDAKDVYTHGHSMRVAEYSRKIAIQAQKDEKFCTEVYYAGLLHDIGKIGIPVSIINKTGKLSDEEFAEIKKHPVIGKQILSSISKSPYLSIGANYHHERYDGRGYPEGLKGDDIPEIARIIAVADSYDAMTSKRSYRDPIPQQKVHEEIVKGMGTQFDPAFAKIMLHLIDLDTEYEMKEHEEVKELSGKSEQHYEEFLSEKSEGILINNCITKIKLHFKSDEGFADETHIPSLIIFDSLDARIHMTEIQQKEMLYTEFARIRFDGNTSYNNIRKIKIDSLENSISQSSFILSEYKDGIDCTIEAVKIKDHIQIKISNEIKTSVITLALPDSSHFAYMALTGEHCTISNVELRKSKETAGENYITRIAEEISFIKDAPTGDIPNVQIDGWRTATTEAISLTDNMEIDFHTQSLPTARLIWHCPFISLYYSDDKKINGTNFREFVLIRIDGENWESYDYARNTIQISKNDAFEGWDSWKAKNKAGMDCHVELKKIGNQIIVVTENDGIFIKSTTTLLEMPPEIYVSLTGDQCAITNIKIKKW